MIITVAGNPGSGKSTVAKLLAQKLGLRHFSVGDLMREMAKERNLSLADLGKIAEGDRSIDVALDERQIQLGRTEDDFVIDGRLSFHFIPQSLKVFLDAELKTRAERIWKDVKVKNLRKEEQVETIREIVDQIQRREKSEKIRYEKYYHLNPYDLKHYDLVIDTTSISAEEAADKVVEFVQKREG